MAPILMHSKESHLVGSDTGLRPDYSVKALLVQARPREASVLRSASKIPSEAPSFLDRPHPSHQTFLRPRGKAIQNGPFCKGLAPPPRTIAKSGSATPVIPAEAGIQGHAAISQGPLDSRLRGNDEMGRDAADDLAIGEDFAIVLPSTSRVLQFSAGSRSW